MALTTSLQQEEQSRTLVEGRERDARHNLGFVLVEKAERALGERRLNEARLFALNALASFDPRRPGPERATNLILNHSFYPSAFFSADSTQHAGPVMSVAFTPDGRTLASGSLDQTVRLWNLSFLYDSRPIEAQIQVAERQTGLHLVDLDLQLLPLERNLVGVRPEPPIWSEYHPFHWLPAAEQGDRQAMLELGILYHRADDLPRAEDWYRKALEAGAPEAKERLDFLHRRPAERTQAPPAPAP